MEIPLLVSTGACTPASELGQIPTLSMGRTVTTGSWVVRSSPAPAWRLSFPVWGGHGDDIIYGQAGADLIDGGAAGPSAPEFGRAANTCFTDSDDTVSNC